MLRISAGRFFVVGGDPLGFPSTSDQATVSQFTLLASTKKGSKPDFHGALGGEQAKELYKVFVSKVQQRYKTERVKDGVFQAMMVRLILVVQYQSRILLIGYRKSRWSMMVQ